MKIKEKDSFEQKAFVALVRQAQLKKTIEYGVLNEEIKYNNHRNIGPILLKNISEELLQLSKDKNIKIPPIQSIVVSKKTGKASGGIEKTNINLEDLHEHVEEVFNFQAWNDVLKHVNEDLVIQTIANIVNVLAEEKDTHLKNFQKKRRALRNLGNRNARQTIFDIPIDREWIFHYGARGLPEPQFNIGFENERKEIRFGFAFSSQPDQGGPPDLNIFKKTIELYNEYMKIKQGSFSSLELWTHEELPINVRDSLIIQDNDYLENDGQVKENTFIFIGISQDIKKANIEEGLNVMSSLYPIYEYILKNVNVNEKKEDNNTSKNSNSKEQEFIFIAGQSSESQKASTQYTQNKREINIDLKHNKIQEKLYKELEEEYGKGNIAKENSISLRRKVDIIVKNKEKYILYEIKTNQTALSCLREAIGQLFEYALYPVSPPSPIEKLVIVGTTILIEDEKKYLEKLNENSSLPIEYRQCSL